MTSYPGRASVPASPDFQSPAPEDVARLEEVGRMLKATREVFLCRVRDSITTGPRWATNLVDYLQASR